MKIGRNVLLLGLAMLLVGSTALAAPEKRAGEEAEKIIRDLKAGIRALEAIGRHEEAERLERVLKDWLAKREHGRREGEERREVEIVKHRIEVLRIAMHGLMEIEAIDAANLVEHRIHSYELALAGRRDEEAMRIRKSAPAPEKLVGPLKRAAEAWAKFGQEKKADLCRRLAEEYAGTDRPHRDGADRERALVKRHIEVMRVAMHGFREAEKKDAAHRIEQVIHVYELHLAGKHDEAMKAREKAPNAGQLAELLTHASEIWMKFGHETKAGQVKELAQHYYQRWKEQQAREKDADAPRRDRDERLARIERKLEEVARLTRELAEELERLKRER